jgi:hypothetical protein
VCCLGVQVVDWLQWVASALDAFNWLLKRQYVDSASLWAASSGAGTSAGAASKKRGAKTEQRASCMLNAVSHFIAVHAFDPAVADRNTVALRPVTTSGAGGASALGAVSDMDGLAPRQLEELCRMRALVACRLFTFIPTALLDATRAGTGPALLDVLSLRGVIGDALFRFALQCILSPAGVGVDTVDSQVRSAVQRRLDAGAVSRLP